jgi:hypothetical protein
MFREADFLTAFSLCFSCICHYSYWPIQLRLLYPLPSLACLDPNVLSLVLAECKTKTVVRKKIYLLYNSDHSYTFRLIIINSWGSGPTAHKTHQHGLYESYVFGKDGKILYPFGNRTPSVKPKIKFFSQIILVAHLSVVSNFKMIVN